jgi:hypothetical protein
MGNFKLQNMVGYVYKQTQGNLVYLKGQHSQHQNVKKVYT